MRKNFALAAFTLVVVGTATYLKEIPMIQFDQQVALDTAGDGLRWCGGGWHPAAAYLAAAYALGLLMLRRWVPKMRERRQQEVKAKVALCNRTKDGLVVFSKLGMLSSRDAEGYPEWMAEEHFAPPTPEWVAMVGLLASAPVAVPLRLLYLAMTYRRQPKLDRAVMYVDGISLKHNAVGLPMSEWFGKRPTLGVDCGHSTSPSVRGDRKAAPGEDTPAQSPEVYFSQDDDAKLRTLWNDFVRRAVGGPPTPSVPPKTVRCDSCGGMGWVDKRLTGGPVGPCGKCDGSGTLVEKLVRVNPDPKPVLPSGPILGSDLTTDQVNEIPRRQRGVGK